MSLCRKVCLSSLFMVSVLTGCGPEDPPNSLHLKIANGSGPAGMKYAAGITSTYLSEKRFLQVVLPDVANPTQQQSDAALATAVVAPAFLESNPDGAVYMMCTINTSSSESVQPMLNRCREQLEQVAKEVGATLVAD